MLKYPTNKNHHNFLQHQIHFRMKFVKQQKLKNFPKHQICTRNNQGHADKSGDSRGNCLIACTPPNSSIEECEKYRHLK